MKTIEELAREAGFEFDSNGIAFGEPFHVDKLARFAALVAEQCAQIAGGDGAGAIRDAFPMPEEWP